MEITKAIGIEHKAPTVVSDRKEAKVIAFNSKNRTYQELSNFFAAEIVIDGKRYATNEHWYQSQKFATSDEDFADVVRRSKTPQEAKNLGGSRQHPLRRDFEQVKEDIMYTGLKAKFTQHSKLHKLLLNTGTTPLVESAPWDSYWGNGRNGQGKNRMGFLLEKLRRELAAAATTITNNEPPKAKSIPMSDINE